MERLWGDLCRRPNDVVSPDWHGDILDDRRAAVREGRTAFVEWVDAKKRLRERFPFALYYDVNEDLIEIYAVLDSRQDP